jgi:RNA polymerase sigma factor (sigma-70 family)
MSRSPVSYQSTNHPWCRLETSLQTLCLADEAHSALHLKVLNEVMREVERGASRILRSPKLRFAGLDGRDIAQEWWARMQSFGFRKYNAERGPIHPFCYRILCNLFADAARKGRVRRMAQLPFHLPDSQPGVCEIAERRDLRRRVRKAVQQLPRHLRIPLKLRYRNNLSSEDVARLCNVSAQTVNWRIFKARARLRTLLADDFRGQPAVALAAD